MKPAFMRRRDIMTQLGISARTFRKLVDSNKLNPVRFVDSKEQPYYRAEEVEALKQNGA